MAVTFPPWVFDKRNITIDEPGDNCDFPQGHCFGNDGGTGVKVSDRVARNRGGIHEVWTIDATGNIILAKELYVRCQFCQKFVYAQVKRADPED